MNSELLLAFVPVFAFSCFYNPILAQTTTSRLPEPPLAAQEDAQKLVNDVYRAEIQKAKSSEEKLALSRKLLQIGLETRNDSTGQYILLKMASDLAVQECDTGIAIRCVETLARNFEIDLLKSKASVLTRVSRVASQPSQHRLLSVQFSRLLDDCNAAERLDIAVPLAEIALASARECKDKVILNRVTERKAEITEWSKAAEAIRAPLAVLEERPLDPAANMAVGKYHCFMRGDWKRGVPMLALGSDMALKELATLELAERPDLIRVADSWWELGTKEAANSRSAMQQHAAEFYRLVLPSLTGLTKSKVESRLKELQPNGRVPGERITNSIGMQLAFIPAGEFVMGAASDDNLAQPSEKPQHLVRITRDFFMGMHEVTQEQYERVTGNNPSKQKNKQNPVECISWFEAIEFCQKLSAMPEERKAKRLYRLPTEAEWEYACRAGSTTKYFFGEDDSSLTQYAWYKSNSQDENHPVGRKEPNAWGLYDMVGGVTEWCQDWHDPNYYTKSPLEDPEGPSKTSELRVFRGGDKKTTHVICRSSYRGFLSPKIGEWSTQGFRVVCEQ